MALLYCGIFNMRDSDYTEYLEQKSLDKKASNKVPYQESTERYWEEMKSRQVGENTPDYDPWTGSWY